MSSHPTEGGSKSGSRTRRAGNATSYSHVTAFAYAFVSRMERDGKGGAASMIGTMHRDGGSVCTGRNEYDDVAEV